MLRMLAVLSTLAALLGVAAMIALQQPPIMQIAQTMLGESWYRISLAGQHVGYMHNRTHRDHTGAWHFQTTTHFLLQDQTPNTISKLLVFDATPPFALQRASYNSRTPGNTTHTQISRQPEGYEARLDRNGQASALPLDWQFELHDFLGFEGWLAWQQPEPGAEFGVRSADFERLRLRTVSYRVVAHNELGYLVENNAPLAATRTQLNRAFRPEWLNMAGLFEVKRANQADAINMQRFANKTNYLFAVDQRIEQHTEVAQLTLRVHGDAQFSLPEHLKTRAGQVSGGSPESFRGETLQYPVRDPAIQRLTQQALRAAGDGDLIGSLVNTTYERLGYRENEPAGSVLTALKTGYGECTDFADLFTTLARAAGYPAITVYGLAYKDGPSPAFMFHAWNEVYADGRWQAVDPTWNQLRTDATHIPLSDADSARLQLANNATGVRLEVRSIRYF